VSARRSIPLPLFFPSSSFPRGAETRLMDRVSFEPQVQWSACRCPRFSSPPLPFFLLLFIAQATNQASLSPFFLLVIANADVQGSSLLLFSLPPVGNAEKSSALPLLSRHNTFQSSLPSITSATTESTPKSLALGQGLGSRKSLSPSFSSSTRD